MDAPTLRSWLISAPRPESIRCAGADGHPHTLEIKHGQKWIDVARSVCALEPVVVEALDAKGGLLRAVRADELEPEADDDDGDPIQVTDVESQRLVIFARLLADAYKHSTSVAFDQLGALFESTAKRAEAQQRTIEALTRRRVVVNDDDDAAPAQTFEQEILQGLFQGKLQGELERMAGAAAKKTATTNGAAKNPQGESDQ